MTDEVLQALWSEPIGNVPRSHVTSLAHSNEPTFLQKDYVFDGVFSCAIFRYILFCPRDVKLLKKRLGRVVKNECNEEGNKVCVVCHDNKITTVFTEICFRDI